MTEKVRDNVECCKGGGTAIVYIKQASGNTINTQSDCGIESSVQDKEAGVRCEV